MRLDGAPGYACLEDWLREFYRLNRQIGLTKNQLGSTAHSLRHGFLLDLYQELAGVSAPVRSDADTSSLARDRAVRKVLAECAGHSRPQVSSAYLGSRRNMRSAGLRRRRKLSTHLADSGPGLDPAPPSPGAVGSAVRSEEE